MVVTTSVTEMRQWWVRPWRALSLTSATGLHNHQFGTSTEREVKGQLFHVLMVIRIRLPLSAVIDVLRARGGAGQEQRAFASVSSERCGALELLVCLIEPAKLGQEITAHTR